MNRDSLKSKALRKSKKFYQKATFWYNTANILLSGGISTSVIYLLIGNPLQYLGQPMNSVQLDLRKIVKPRSKIAITFKGFLILLLVLLICITIAFFYEYARDKLGLVNWINSPNPL